MPEQIKRLLVPFILAIVILVGARHFLVPKTFGKFGHYRAAAIDEIANQKIQYVGQSACVECHEDIAGEKGKSYHKDVSCETCHGASAEHVENPSEHKPHLPKDRGEKCLLCHEYLVARPTGFPQIVEKTHNPVKLCISCHKPHDPTPKEVPFECSACHAKISREKTVSLHSYVKCTECHSTPREHKINPRAFEPSKPANREFCGKCHSQTSQLADKDLREKKIPRVDIVKHYPKYLCWECHYQHSPK